MTTTRFRIIGYPGELVICDGHGSDDRSEHPARRLRPTQDQLAWAQGYWRALQSWLDNGRSEQVPPELDHVAPERLRECTTFSLLVDDSVIGRLDVKGPPT